MRNQSTPVAVEAVPFITAGIVAFFLCIVLHLVIPALIAVGVTLFVLFFFRNPGRTVPANEQAVIAPADGMVIFLGPVQEERLGGEVLKISIFMSVFNVHINRVPVTGTVVDQFYLQGKFLDVRDERATFENEQRGLVIQTDSGVRMMVVQVAGLIARRIVCYATVGTKLVRGQRYGLIRFGSRLDVYLPKETLVQVKMGERTVAGETILGTLA
jgi:phosphatidylserine decarboxylase